jgi:hypothetical protein
MGKMLITFYTLTLITLGRKRIVSTSRMSSKRLAPNPADVTVTTSKWSRDENCGIPVKLRSSIWQNN